MGDGIERLLSVSSPSLGASFPAEAIPLGGIFQRQVARELLEVLRTRNGFYAFQSALLLRPLSLPSEPLGLIEWNDPALWRAEYKTNIGEALYFSEDLFGNQFCIKDDAIYSFDAETGEQQQISKSMDGWALWVLEKHRVRTGWPLAQQWAAAGGTLEAGQRLVPRIPFVLGGEFSLKNLQKLNDADSLRYRAGIANQLRDCPDGSTVVLKTDWEKGPCERG